MNISWLPTNGGVFVAEFSSDFSGDLDAVKNAGFRTYGPPEWIWYAPSPGIVALNRLRQNRPKSGLTISPEALAVFQPLAQQWQANEDVKKQLAEQKKSVKKRAKKEQKESSKCDWLPVGKEYLSAEDLPPLPPFISEHPIVKIEPIGVCRICLDPTYGWPDLVDLCLYCDKQISENNA